MGVHTGQSPSGYQIRTRFRLNLLNFYSAFESWYRSSIFFYGFHSIKKFSVSCVRRVRIELSQPGLPPATTELTEYF